MIKTVTEYQIWDWTGKVCVFLDEQTALNWVKNGGLFKGSPVYKIKRHTMKVRTYAPNI